MRQIEGRKQNDLLADDMTLYTDNLKDSTKKMFRIKKQMR